MEEDVLIFVDGELYKGVVTFNNYKGIGWPGGCWLYSLSNKSCALSRSFDGRS
jgi:hypothetical protein